MYAGIGASGLEKKGTAAGKILAAGPVSGTDQAKKAADLLQGMGVHLLVNQIRYSMFCTKAEDGLLDMMETEGVGGVAFAPLHGGMLTDKYIHGIPEDSRAARDPRYLKPGDITE
ncbi:aldo/keto reductase, partial [uncultured Desulfovibrio sp.]|uniref:aldo/keto reductase n=1 Tax=uncultured Desulfovibrio sp. TaxID=167968 RepID=UPI0026183997